MRRFATTTAVLLTAVVTGAVTAVAADAPAKADILKYSVKHGTTVKLAVRIRKATNPKTNEHWIQGFSNLD